ncbi:MAG TPA: RluA family pseudouridine synthase [Rickettsiales bacterium]|nr:RluA family pseudouridine synthase [Rickettsiales bacterium]
MKIEITEHIIGGRIDKVLTQLCQPFPRTKIQEFIKEGRLTNHNKIFTDNSYKIKADDDFEFNPPEFQEKTLKPTSIPLDIIYEDNDVIVINKQAGLTTHPGSGNEDDTLANALLELYGKNLSQIGGDFRPGIVHRLDKDTSGLMVVAKNDQAHLHLSEQLEKRDLKRTYIAFIWGVLNPRIGKIEAFMEKNKVNRLKMEIVKEGGKYSSTNYKTLKTYLDNSISKVEFNLDTGRTHQIRLHCSHRGCPIIGDQIYGGKTRHLKDTYNIKNFIDSLPRQALHSYKIKFFQPTTGELKSFEIPLPKDLKELESKISK